MKLQKFVMPYTLIPNFRESAAYGELRQDISPRWFVAARYGYSCNSATGKLHSIETGAGYRPNRDQLIKVAYEEQRYPGTGNTPNHMLGVQFITSLHRTVLSR